MGMGFPSTSVFNTPSLFQNLVAEGQIRGIFAFKLEEKEDNEEGDAQLNIGQLNSRLYHGDPTYTPVTQEGFWQIEFSALKVGDSTIVGPTQAIVDPVRFEPI